MTKTRILSLAGIALLALAAVSCNKEVTTNPIFTATTESDAKTHLGTNGLDLLWNNSGETIAINDGTNTAVYTATSVSDNIATFHYTSGDAIAEEGSYTVIYPADAYVAPGVIALPHVQPYSAEGLSDYPMYAEANGTELQFKNLCAVLHLNLTKSGKSVRYITVTSNLPMAGNFNIDYNEGNPTLTACGDYSNAAMLTIDCGSTGVDISNGADFYINLPAQTYESELFQIEIIYTDNTVSVKTTNAEFTAARGARYDLVYGTNDLANDRTLGLFTINDQGTQVVFSSGNLYYFSTTTSSPHYWRFYNDLSLVNFTNEHYDPTSMGSDPSCRMHFHWSTTASEDYYGYPIPLHTTAATGSFKDWSSIFGTNAMNWRTLNSDEWNYLINRTVNDHRSYTTGSINYGTTSSTRSVYGIFIFPDNWVDQTCITVEEDFMSRRNKIDLEDWTETLEPSGVIFLPVSGYLDQENPGLIKGTLTRFGASLKGYYWSSTEVANDDSKAETMYIFNNGATTTTITGHVAVSKRWGLSVRLVRPVNPTTTAK